WLRRQSCPAGQAQLDECQKGANSKQKLAEQGRDLRAALTRALALAKVLGLNRKPETLVRPATLAQQFAILLERSLRRNSEDLIRRELGDRSPSSHDFLFQLGKVFASPALDFGLQFRSARCFGEQHECLKLETTQTFRNEAVQQPFILRL